MTQSKIKERWLNIYSNGRSELNLTRVKADSSSLLSKRIACIKIEFENGQGLKKCSNCKKVIPGGKIRRIIEHIQNWRTHCSYCGQDIFE